MRARGDLQALLAAARDGDLVALLLERVLEAARDRVLVFNDQNRGRHRLASYNQPSYEPTNAFRPEPRAVRGKAVAHLRRSGILPAVVYGAGLPSQNIALDAHEFELLRRRAGRHAVSTCSIEGDGKAAAGAAPGHPGAPGHAPPLHVDLLVVNMEEERTVDVPLVFVGQSEAVDQAWAASCSTCATAVLVRAKPDDLPSGIELDITPLVDFEAVVHASDLIMPPGVTLITPLEEALLRVQPPRREEVIAPPVAEELEGGAEAAEGAPEAGPVGEGAAEESTPAGEE